MTLSLKKTYNLYSQTTKCLEKISENLTMLNITFKIDMFQLDSRPIHKRYDFGDFPPLDISFDSETGLLKEITIFINIFSISSDFSYEEDILLNQKGYPCFNIEMLKKHEYYYDETCQMIISLYESRLLICKLNEVLCEKNIINEEINFFLNDKNEFVGFQMNKLSNDDLKLLKR